MRTIILTIASFFLATTAMQAQSNTGEEIADRIASRLKDSLSLSSQQKDQLLAINLQLHASKIQIRQQYTGSDSLRFHLQRVENTRDSLYRPVLTEEKYLLYRQKKQNLVNNN